MALPYCKKSTSYLSFFSYISFLLGFQREHVNIFFFLSTFVFSLKYGFLSLNSEFRVFLRLENI